MTMEPGETLLRLRRALLRFSIRPFATTSRYNGPNLDLQQAGREMGADEADDSKLVVAGEQAIKTYRLTLI